MCAGWEGSAQLCHLRSQDTSTTNAPRILPGDCGAAGRRCCDDVIPCLLIKENKKMASGWLHGSFSGYTVIGWTSMSNGTGQMYPALFWHPTVSSPRIHRNPNPYTEFRKHVLITRLVCCWLLQLAWIQQHMCMYIMTKYGTKLSMCTPVYLLCENVWISPAQPRSTKYRTGFLQKITQTGIVTLALRAKWHSPSLHFNQHHWSTTQRPLKIKPLFSRSSKVKASRRSVH